MTVVCDEVELGNHFKMGVAVLTAESSLNSLTLEMIHSLKPKLLEWQKRNDIAFIWIEGAGEKAFCAGGDIRKLYESICAKQYDHELFFAAEYSLDYMIHTSPKPIVVYGHGIVMGGGLGIMAGAQFRIVTETSKLAMPEITIGLYPDVGATYFLTKMPDNLGLFLGLTGTRLNAADAKFVGLADFFIERALKDELQTEFKTQRWSDLPGENRAALAKLFEKFQLRSHKKFPTSEVKNHAPVLAKLMKRDSIFGIAQEFAKTSADPWLQTAFDNFRRGSPTSAHVIYAQFQKGKDLSLKDAFELEFVMSSQFARHHDLAEGIRALLIERDNKPQWSPGDLQHVTREDVERYFTPPWPSPKSIFY